FTPCLLRFFFFSCYGHHRDLHSFPTRRSSDLTELSERAIRRYAQRGKPSVTFERQRRREGLMLVRTVTYRGFVLDRDVEPLPNPDRKSTRLNSSHDQISYAVFCLKKKKNKNRR